MDQGIKAPPHSEINEQVEGNHAITLDFSGKPDGIYFIALVADHKDVCKIKAIKAN
jgi:hypothetical protein